MAKYDFLLNKLRKDNRNLHDELGSNFKSINKQLKDSGEEGYADMDQFLDDVANGKALPKFGDLDLNKFAGELRPKIKTIAKDLTKEVDDISNMSTEDLKDRFGAYEFIKNTPLTTLINENLLATQIINNLGAMEKIHPAGLSNDQIVSIGSTLANQTVASGGDINKALYGNPIKWDSPLLRDVGFLSGIQNSINTGTFSYSSTSEFDPVGYKATKDILDDRGIVSGWDSEVTGLKEELPTLMANERERYYKGERGRLKDYITGDVAPAVAETMRSRGLANSGEVPATIMDEYGRGMSSINLAEAQQSDDEMNFWADKAYEKTLNDLITARTGVTEKISSIRSEALDTSSQNFIKAQTLLTNQFNLDMFREQSRDALSRYRSQLETEAKQKKEEGTAATLANVGGTVATITGLKMLG